MSLWTSIRDTVEDVGLGAADILTGGLTAPLSTFLSKGAQQSALGKLVTYGGDILGLGNLATGAYDALTAGTTAAQAAAAGTGAAADAASAAGTGSSLLNTATNGVSSLWGNLSGDVQNMFSGNIFQGYPTLGGGSSAAGATDAASNAALVSGTPMSLGPVDTTQAAINSLSNPLAAAAPTVASPAAAAAASGSAGGLSGLAAYAKQMAPLASVFGGLNELQMMQQLKNNPYSAQMSALTANPSSVITSPAGQAALQGVYRNQAATGMYGSSNMGNAVAQTSGQLYQNQMSALQAQAAAYNQQLTGAGGMGLMGLGSIASGLGSFL